MQIPLSPVLPTLLLGLSALSAGARATVVEFQTSLGDFKVNLFDQHTPKTVNNFLDYVNSAAYKSSVVHRSAPGFVIQGGGFGYDGQWPLTVIDQAAAVDNEPRLSNVRGTLAMAKLNGDPDSATNQWFVNLADNSANLDRQNGGFTVFGQVMDDGMTVVDQMAALPRFAQPGGFTAMPLANYSQTDAGNGVEPGSTNLVILYDIQVLDDAKDSAAGLSPVVNTLIDQAGGGNNGGGGGSLGGGLLLLAALAGWRGRRHQD